MPVTKQSIAIIRAGRNKGSALAKRMVGGNYRLLLFHRDPEQMGALTEEIQQAHPGADLERMHGPHECSWEADIIILAVPHGAEKEIVGKIREVTAQKIVISIADPTDEDFNKRTTEAGACAAEELQQWLPHSKGVKVFNTTFTADFEPPVTEGRQGNAFIAGDDREALHTVTELMRTAGFNPVIAGDRSVRGTPERMQFTNQNNDNEPAG